MREVFYEEATVLLNEKGEVSKYNILKIVSTLFFVLAFLWTIFILYWKTDIFSNGNIIFPILAMVVPFVSFILAGVFCLKATNKVAVVYDYSFISGQIRIGKVVNNKKRFNVLDFETSQIERVGPFGSKVYDRYALTPGVKKIFLTSNKISHDDYEFYYFLVDTNKGKRLYVIECTKKFILTVVTFANKRIFEQGE